MYSKVYLGERGRIAAQYHTGKHTWPQFRARLFFHAGVAARTQPGSVDAL
jgi:hypothetical protein